jgi:hypothetical protein
MARIRRIVTDKSVLIRLIRAIRVAITNLNPGKLRMIILVIAFKTTHPEEYS